MMTNPTDILAQSYHKTRLKHHLQLMNPLEPILLPKSLHVTKKVSIK